MRLIALKIRNFRVLKAADLTFTDEVVGITGVNGSGKTSIIEAIAWALYGNQAARSGREEIKSTFARPDESCEVSLDFLINEEKYRVIRRLAGKAERAEVELYRGEASESVGVNETKKYVGELLGLDWRGFLTSFLARQQELNALSTLQPAKRKDHLAGMLGIEKLDRALLRAKEAAKVAAGQVDVLGRQIAETDSLKAVITLLTDRRSELEAAVTRTETARKAAEITFTAARDEYVKAQDARSAWTEAVARLDAARKTVANLNTRLAELKAELAQLDQAEKESADLAARLIRLDPARRELDSLTDVKNRQQLRDQLQKQCTDLENERTRLSAESESAVAAVNQFDHDLASLPATLAAELETSRTQLESAREQYSHLQAEQKSQEVQRNKLQTQITSIASLGPDSVCDRCHRPLGDDLPTIRGHFAAEMTQLTDTLARLAADMKIAAASGQRLREQVQSLESCVTRRNELLIKREAADKERAACLARIEETRRRLAEVGERLSEIGAVDFDPARFETIRAEVDQLEKLRLQASRLEGSLARRPQVESALTQTNATLADAQAETDALTRHRDSLGYSEETFAAARIRFQDAQQIFETARDASLAAIKEFELTGKELDGKHEQLARLARAAEELEQYRARHFYGEKLASLFGEFRELLISRIRPTLSDISSRLLSDMTEGRYTMVELDEKYNLTVLDSGQFYGVDRFSGGEKDLANLCLRLAISEALLASAGMSRSFVILDEVFGSQDDGRKELIVQALTNLKHRFPQIFLITHVGDIKDRVECLIEVTPTGYGWSTVSINGTPV